ncbi:MAG: FHA domain-containing protein [Acidobacteriota bacterium]|nr:FHA domain-containing protein [Acidobacteriota bacterium]
MIICERCRTQNVDEAQYCDECGASLLAQGRHSGHEQSEVPATADSQPGARKNRASGANSGAHSSDGAVGAALSSSAEKVAGGRISSASLKASGADAAASPAHARLTIHRGRSAGKEFPLNDDEAYIGRWDADGGIFPDVDLDADDPEAKVSRRHARITRRGEQYFVEDLGSTNGTFINRGRRLLPGDRQLLNDGDELIIGKTFLKFQVIK